MDVRRVAKKKTYVCGLCLEPFRLEGRADHCISLCEKCWDMATRKVDSSLLGREV